MILSETSNRSPSRWSQACVLLCAVVVLPLGVAYAQDYEAVAKRLKAAVEAGELTGPQARAMLGALKKQAAAEEPASDKAGQKDADLEPIISRLSAAVQSGKLTKEEAQAKLDAIRKAGAKSAKESDRDADLKAAWKKLQAMVKAGEISEEQAKAKITALEKQAALQDQGMNRAKAYLMQVKKELGAAVEAGKISQEDAAKKFQVAEKAIQQRMATLRGEGDSKRITEGDLARAAHEIRTAIADGKISAEEGRAKMQALRKMRGEQREGVAQEGAAKRPGRANWENIERRIKAAVERGDMTREEAMAKYRELRKRMAESGKR